MKSNCIKCKRSYDETEWMQYTYKMNTKDKREYFHSMLCPTCHILQKKQIGKISYNTTNKSISKSFS